LLRSKKAYKEELRKYRLSLLPDDMKASKVGTKVEIRSMHNTGGNRLCGTSELSASELIIDLFAREAERVGDLCALTLQLPPLSSSKCLEGEVACKTLAEKATSVLVAKRGVGSVSLEVGTVGILPDRSGSFIYGQGKAVKGRGDTSWDVVGGVKEGLASSRKKQTEDVVELCKGVIGAKGEVVSRAGIKAWKVKKQKPTVTLNRVLLPRCPLILWSLEAFKEIGNALGKFIYVDPKLLTGSDRRVGKLLVEVDLFGGLPNEIDIGWRGVVIQQGLDFLGVPFICIIYKDTGHLRFQCSGHRRLKLS
jgi:hypothetical protein